MGCAPRGVNGRTRQRIAIVTLVLVLLFGSPLPSMARLRRERAPDHRERPRDGLPRRPTASVRRAHSATRPPGVAALLRRGRGFRRPRA